MSKNMAAFTAEEGWGVVSLLYSVLRASDATVVVMVVVMMVVVVVSMAATVAMTVGCNIDGGNDSDDAGPDG